MAGKARTGRPLVEWLKAGFCALLLAYFLSLVARALLLEMEYSVPQWLLIGLLVACAVALLAWQTRKAWRTRAGK